jgi:hypothetical protein
MRVQPKGLWILGVNGRVDLIKKDASWILVDRSEPLAPVSNWHLYSSNRQGPFARQLLQELLLVDGDEVRRHVGRREEVRN